MAAVSDRLPERLKEAGGRWAVEGSREMDPTGDEGPSEAERPSRNPGKAYQKAQKLDEKRSRDQYRG